MEDIHRKRKARSKSPVSRQAGFNIGDGMNYNSETEVTEVAFLSRALTEAITQGASYIHIEPADDGVDVRYRVDGEYREAARETRDVSAVMTRPRVLAGLPVVPPLGQEWGVIELQNKERHICSAPKCCRA
jgi:type II secretory ATPase GspE/PulE/Tfp pilus assembly ATPase PilB-like protein